MVYERTEYPSWSWSLSRKATFDECLRKYYYNYYLSHNGWEKGASDESRQAYRLKKLTGLHLLLGTGIHQAIEYVCKNISQIRQLPEEKIILNIVKDILNKAWNESRKNQQEWFEKPNSYSMLHEFYYKGEVSPAVISKIKDKMNNSVSNIFVSKTINALISSQDYEIKITESMDTFNFYDTAIYAIPDLVYINPQGKWVIVDWKTGKESGSHAQQIIVYCLYLIEKYNVNVDDIIGRIEYLSLGKSVDVQIRGDSLKKAQKNIMDSINDMKKVLFDTENNIPDDKDCYSLTENRRFCPWCNFHEMCKGESQKMGLK